MWPLPASLVVGPCCVPVSPCCVPRLPHKPASLHVPGSFKLRSRVTRAGGSDSTEDSAHATPWAAEVALVGAAAAERRRQAAQSFGRGASEPIVQEQGPRGSPGNSRGGGGRLVRQVGGAGKCSGQPVPNYCWSKTVGGTVGSDKVAKGQKGMQRCGHVAQGAESRLAQRGRRQEPRRLAPGCKKSG